MTQECLVDMKYPHAPRGQEAGEWHVSASGAKIKLATVGGLR